MKNILFSINTEYHIFIISSLIKQMYWDTSKYNVTIVIQTNKGVNQFKNTHSFEHLKSNVIILEIDLNSKKFDPVVSETLERILSKDYERFIFFLEQTAINQYLVNKLSVTDTIITLAPEGTKPYITIAKAALPSRIKATLKNYRFYRTQKLKINKFYFVTNKNGYLKETEEVMINHPEKYPNLTRKKVVPVEFFTTPEEIELASKVFDFDIQKEIPERDGILFYLNQWYVEFKVYDFEIEILKALLERYPDKKIYIKLHPNTHKFQVERLEKIDRVILNKSTIPAEIFIANLTNSIIFSFWSASLLINNPTCKFYWLQKMLEKQKLMKWWSIINPTKHIKDVYNVDEIIY
ncbi:hypothetical protein E0W68_00630 [Flavobacterium salilacus subsp. salilacus]|uniref:hypothetical protein n=1 Tax=Flavobacterium TaxID=237 RepID=UPI0010750566|nr:MULTISPECIES: hypothetical protein [Flavobacterium]KAF2519770.1 hypothetical protein E0W68_00630 [Flavobacterium salilacus subsp. salilacus]MBE1614334.1 hypothetical protein [Flavobacterium sp. SaA2.13]